MRAPLGESAAHHNAVGHGEVEIHLAQAVAQQDVGGGDGITKRGVAQIIWQGARPAQDGQTRFFEHIADGIKAFRAAWDIDDHWLGIAGVAQPGDGVQVEVVFAFDGGGKGDHGAVFAAQPAACGGARARQVGGDRLIKAQLAGDMQVANTDRGKPIRLKPGFHKAAGHVAHDFRDQAPVFFIAGHGFGGVLRVAHEKRDAGAPGGHNHARPDLDLHDQPVFRAEGAEETGKGPGGFEWHPDGAQLTPGDGIGKDTFGFTAPGGGEMGCHHGFAARQKGMDQRNGRAQLAQADGMDPDRTRQGVAIPTKPLGQMRAIGRVFAGAFADIEQDHGHPEMPEHGPEAQKGAQFQTHGAGFPRASRSPASGSSAPRACCQIPWAAAAISGRRGSLRAAARLPGGVQSAALALVNRV